MSSPLQSNNPSLVQETTGKKPRVTINIKSSEASELLIANLKGTPLSTNAPATPTSAKRLLDKEKSLSTLLSNPSSVVLDNHDAESVEDSGKKPEPRPSLFKKKIVGDLFGTNTTDSLEGLMYRFRLTEQRVDQDTNTIEKSEERAASKKVVKTKEIVDSDSDVEQDINLLHNMNPKQQLALTIKNWATFPENDEHLINEGAIYALIALCYMDDSTIRKCCASAFFHLSSRESNRHELLSIGATAGVITLAMQARNWKVAKLCALTLCNLSMQTQGEAIMAKEGAILALVVLLGIKGQSLLPICVQALYNMTSAFDHFKGIERIIKALLNMSSVGYDHSEFLMKALVNCARYSWLRLRIIEDGGINSIHNLIPNLGTMENRHEIVFYILTALRSLSDSSGCRMDMLQKGTIELLNNVLPFSDEKDQLLIVKIIHNFLLQPNQISLASFELIVNIIHYIVENTTFVSTLQYCAACYHIITKEKCRKQKYLAIPIVESMDILLSSTDSMIQFYTVSTCGNIFFDNLCDDVGMVEHLVAYFITHASKVTDKDAKQALALAVAKLSQEEKYLEIMEHQELLNMVLHLLMDLRSSHHNSLLLQESCCIAICRIALRIKENLTNEEKQRISQIFWEMLTTNDSQYVLTSIISGLRALGSVGGLSPKELLFNPQLLHNIAVIIGKYQHVQELVRYGCAVFAVFSQDPTMHDLLAEDLILQILFNHINSEDPITCELVANSVCNLSMHTKACTMMIHKNVVNVLDRLACSTSESILDICAKLLCNLTVHEELHEIMLKDNFLNILNMISLVRTVSSHTKYTCARALLNLIKDENLKYISESGAIRIFASLSTIPFTPIQNICSKGFHIMTLNTNRRKELIKQQMVLQSLFHMIKSSTNSTSSTVKVRLGIAIINLLSCPEINQEVIENGGLSCLKLLSTLDFEELREATCKIILNLAINDKFHGLLAREPIVPIITYTLQTHERFHSFTIGIYAMSYLSQIPIFKKILIRDLACTTLINTVFQGKIIDRRICQEVCRIWAHLSYLSDEAENFLSNGSFSVALEILYTSKLAQDPITESLIILMVRNFSNNLIARKHIMDQNIIGLLIMILLADTERTKLEQTQQYLIETSTALPLSPGIKELQFAQLVRASSTDSIGSVPTKEPSLQTESTCSVLPNTDQQRIKSIGYAAMIKIIHHITQSRELRIALMNQGVMILLKKICLPLISAEEQEKLIEKTEKAMARESLENENTKEAYGSPMKNNGKNIHTLAEEMADHKIEYQAKIPYVERSASTGHITVAVDSNPLLKAQTIHSPHNITLDKSKSFSLNEANQPPIESFLALPRIPHRLFFTTEQVDTIAMSLQLLSHTTNCHEAMVKGDIMSIFRSLIYSDHTEVTKCEIATTLANITLTKNCREPLVKQGACELLIALSITSDRATKTKACLALGHLSEITLVQTGLVASLLLLALNLEDYDHNLSPDEFLMNMLNKSGKKPISNTSLANTAKDLVTQLKSKGHIVISNKDLNNSNADHSNSGNNPDSSGNPSHNSDIISNNGENSNTKNNAHKSNYSYNQGQNLTNLLRDLMADRVKFDSYLEALLRNNHKNLSNNDFVPKNSGSENKALNVTTTSTTTTTTNPSFGGHHLAANKINKNNYNIGIPNPHSHNSPSKNSKHDPNESPHHHHHLLNQPEEYIYPASRIYVSFKHHILLQTEESHILMSDYEHYLYRSPEYHESYPPKNGGYSDHVNLDLPLPGIRPDRELEPPNRSDELLKIPINQHPLPKDLRPPSYLEHHRLVTENANGTTTFINLPNAPGNKDKDGSRSPLKKAESTSNIESPNKRKSSKLMKQHSELLGKNLAIDPRSPLLVNHPHNTPLFRTNTSSSRESRDGSSNNHNNNHSNNNSKANTPITTRSSLPNSTLAPLAGAPPKLPALSKNGKLQRAKTSSSLQITHDDPLIMPVHDMI